MNQGWWHSVQSVDVDEHARHLGQFDWRYDQLSGGPFSARLAELSMPRIRVFREHLVRGTQQSGLLPPGSIGLGLALHEDHPLWMNGMRIHGERAVVSPDAADIEMCTAPDCGLGFVVADATVIEDVLQRTGSGPAGYDRGKVAVIQLPRPSQALRQLIWMVHGDFGVAPETLRSDDARRLIEDQFILELVEVLSAATALPEERNALLRKRVVDRARELMLDNVEKPLSILDVCKHVGASRRKLNYCFQEVLGTTPVAYMRAIRLNGVRRQLLGAAAGDRVYDAAARWGFWHFGQFSTDYKRQFGELPSRTLQRARNGGLPASDVSFTRPQTR